MTSRKNLFLERNSDLIIVIRWIRNPSITIGFGVREERPDLALGEDLVGGDREFEFAVVSNNSEFELAVVIIRNHGLNGLFMASRGEAHEMQRILQSYEAALG
ncbi:hypothetical protein AKJ16_DCAP11519 [Drosera capensis]